MEQSTCSSNQISSSISFMENGITLLYPICFLPHGSMHLNLEAFQLPIILFLDNC